MAEREPLPLVSMPLGDAPLRDRVIFWLGVALSLAHLYFNTIGTLPELWTSAIHFSGFGLLCVLIYPLAAASGPGIRRSFARGGDLAAGAAAAAAAPYLILMEQPLYDRGVSFIWSDWIVSFAAILAAIEFARRTTGLVIPALIVIALTYVVWWGRFVGGMFNFPGLTEETLLFRSFFGADGMFGPIARISSTFVFMFILFGAFLLRSGAGAFIIALARGLAGRVTGGAGLIAVVASGLTGTVSGSAVANTVSTGVITIPLMQRAGFPARFAAAVEASASTGGQLMPPIMGAGAFIMASYTGIDYLAIVAVSFLPALLYFLSVGFFVRIEAKRSHVRGEAEDAPPISETLRQGPAFLLPIALLVGLLVYGFTPVYAAGIATLSVVVTSWLTPSPMGPRAILEALALGARNMTTTAVLLIAIGLIVNVVATTGIGNTVSLMVTEWAGGSLIITLVFIALAALILGMGLPVTAAYIVLATLAAPAIYDLMTEAALVGALSEGALPETARALVGMLVPGAAGALGAAMPAEEAARIVAALPPEMTGTIAEQVLAPGVLITALLSAHMIIFWLSQFSNVTPPVCLTAFAAAAIAGTAPMPTGFAAWRIAKGLYVVPLLFAYTPFLSGDPAGAFLIFATGVAGLYALTGAMEGFLEGPVSWVPRLLLAGSGIVLLWPSGWPLKLAAFGVMAFLIRENARASRKGRARALAGGP